MYEIKRSNACITYRQKYIKIKKFRRQGMLNQKRRHTKKVLFIYCNQFKVNEQIGR